jgi:hypothetical protein
VEWHSKEKISTILHITNFITVSERNARMLITSKIARSYTSFLKNFATPGPINV